MPSRRTRRPRWAWSRRRWAKPAYRRGERGKVTQTVPSVSALSARVQWADSTCGAGVATLPRKSPSLGERTLRRTQIVCRARDCREASFRRGEAWAISQAGHDVERCPVADREGMRSCGRKNCLGTGHGILTPRPHGVGDTRLRNDRRAGALLLATTLRRRDDVRQEAEALRWKKVSARLQAAFWRRVGRETVLRQRARNRSAQRLW